VFTARYGLGLYVMQVKLHVQNITMFKATTTTVIVKDKKLHPFSRLLSHPYSTLQDQGSSCCSVTVSTGRRSPDCTVVTERRQHFLSLNKLTLNVINPNNV